LTETGVDLLCTNTDECPEQIIGRLTYFTQRSVANITGLSDKLIRRFIDQYGVHDIPDLYTLPFDDIKELEGFGEKSVENLREAVAKSTQLEDYKFLAGLGIDGVGGEVARLICSIINADEPQN
jgi:DNA ligase (NAD+)